MTRLAENTQSDQSPLTNDRAARPLGTTAPSTISDLTKRNVQAISQLEKALSVHRGTGDRVADAITRFVGSMSFIYLHIAWFSIWIIANSSSVLPEPWRLDPFPFTFLTFIVSLEAIFLSTFILISQNHEERLAQRRSHLDLQVNLLSEQENSRILQMLESIQSHLGIAVDPETKQLEEAARPEQIAREIDIAMAIPPRDAS
jgi:uncharacterized membrane protein